MKKHSSCKNLRSEYNSRQIMKFLLTTQKCFSIKEWPFQFV